MNKNLYWIGIVGTLAATVAMASGPQTARQTAQRGDIVRCANLVYAVNKTSVCYSDRFLVRMREETNIRTDSKFTKAKLGTVEVFQFPFSIMTGEGGFSLTPKERINLKYYVTHGGFLVASASCSDPEWTRSMRSELSTIFPDTKLKTIPLSHPLYHTVYKIDSTTTIHDHRGANLEGLYYKNKIVLVLSADGLNDTTHAVGCCCCGGDELDRSEYINVNILAYALLH